MNLGFPVLSPSRVQVNKLAIFAIWESESAIDDYLSRTTLGRVLAGGWHVRLALERRWGSVRELDVLDEPKEKRDPDAPVVAVTLARMRLTQVPRFIRWGLPVERLVRSHQGITLATAAIRFPRTVSTFTIWRSQHEMLKMVRGHSSDPMPRRHVEAMKERERKDFHTEFTTLRFRPLTEHGEWQGRTQIVPVTSIPQ